MTATTDETMNAAARLRVAALRRGPLRREDWLDAGLEMLAATGVDGLTVESLARRLDVTESHFASAFGDRARYLAALLERWEAGQTDTLIALHDRRAAAGAKLREFFYALLPELEPTGPELALRNWARRDRRAQAAVNAVDARRTVYLEDAFRELGCDATEAALRASFFLGLIFAEALVDRGEDSEAREARIALCLETVSAL